MMMRERILLTSLFLCMGSNAVAAMNTQVAAPVVAGPMNAAWFSNPDNPFKPANELYGDQRWKEASRVYTKLLQNKALGNEYDRDMAKVNLASCLWAQGIATTKWRHFNNVLGLPKEQSFVGKNPLIEAVGKKPTALIETHLVGIGDIWHFFPACLHLAKLGYDVTVSVRPFLMQPLSGIKGVKIISEKDEQPKTDFRTHLVGLVGDLKLHPAELQLNRPKFVVSPEAKAAIFALIKPALKDGKIILAGLQGEDREATLMGGKLLPYKKGAHGRHLTSEPFNALLKKYPDKLVLLDCSGNNPITVDEDQKKQYLKLPAEKTPFDMHVALAAIMKKYKQIFLVGADNGPTNVITGSADLPTQDGAFVMIPNGKESDMRMQNIKGKDSMYKQMLSNCWVLKCANPAEQGNMLEQAYLMTLARQA